MATELLVEDRTEKGTRKMNKLREQGRVPAVSYKEGNPGTLISVEEKIFMRLIHAGERIMILKGAEGGDRQALVKDIQFNTFGDRILHIDFHELKAGQTINLKIEIVLKGSAQGLGDGGQMNHTLHQIEVACLPDAVPDKIVVDVSHLKLGESVKVSDIKVEAGVEIISKADTMVAVCEEPKKNIDKTDEPEDGGTSSEPEVLTAKKEDDAKGEGGK